MKLRDEVDIYLAQRRTMGFQLKSVEPLLVGFCHWLQEAGQDEVFSVDDAVRWAKTPTNAADVWWSQRLTAVRPFAAWLNARGADIPVLPATLLPVLTTRREPFVYSQSDLDSLLNSCPLVFPNSRVCATMRMIIGLLAVTGLRTGEALKLTVEDCNWDKNLLLVHGTKRPLDRLVPLHPTTASALRSYLVLPERLSTNPALLGPIFVSYKGVGFVSETIEQNFRKLVDATGIWTEGRPRPRLHDFRHTFATRHMIAAYAKGDNPDRVLTLLSAWLGHTSPAHTYWYLSAVPELLLAAVNRLELQGLERGRQ